jgi:hypothetical protein
MRPIPRLARLAAIAAISVTVPAALAAPALASAQHSRGWPSGQRVVYVQSDNTAGNQVIVYRQAADGTLTQAGTYSTGGFGGVLAGSVVDHLASQGSLGYDRRAGLLVAVNAGSDTISVFTAAGDNLALQQVLPSGGEFPVSVAIHGDLVYVLNALGGGSVQGYRIAVGRLIPLPGSGRALGLDQNASPQFTNTPGQVAFSPDGSQLIVTTKANGNDIDVFAVGQLGYLSPGPVVNPEGATVPFAISFDSSGHLVIAQAGPNALATYALQRSGEVTPIDSLGDDQAATCWVTQANGIFYASNAGSATVSGYTISRGGSLSLLGDTSTDAGTVDAAASPDGRFLYVQTGGSGIVDEFSIGAAGGLTEVGSVTVPGGTGGEGIAAG